MGCGRSRAQPGGWGGFSGSAAGATMCLFFEKSLRSPAGRLPVAGRWRVRRATGSLTAASEMCEHSQREALDRGYQSMQHNLVAATNEAAVRLWMKHGFEVVGTLPEAFRHRQLGYVDAYVMYKKLMA